MAPNKKKTAKTMDIVAPKKKKATRARAAKKPTTPVNTKVGNITISADPGTIEVKATPVKDEEAILSETLNEAFPENDYPFEEEIEKPMHRRSDPELKTKEVVQKETPMVKEPSTEKSFFKNPLKIISLLLVLGMAVSVGILIFNISRSNLLPAKLFYPGVAILAVIALLFLRFTIRKKTKVATHIVLDIFSLIFLAASLFGNFKLSDTLAFLDKNFNGASYQTLVYDVISNKNSKYDSKESLSGTNIIAPPDFVLSEDELINTVKDQLNANLTFDENNDQVTNLPLENTDGLILLGDAIYTSMTEASADYASATKVVTTVKIEKRIEKDSDNGDLAEKPFSIFLSGIDSRDDYMPYTSRSDVNMAIIANPKTGQLLLLTIPRDYQIHVPGTTGDLNDKMTHTGSLGGVQLSKATAEDLLGIKFNDYIRVNFNFVVGLVDAIGGITINSDWNTPISCWTDRGCVIEPGDNAVDGRCALAFARERMAYNTGDTHRAENQQQVIGKILEKVSKSSTLINSYSSILDALTGTFDTSLTSSDIQSLVRLQLDKSPSWKVHSYTLATSGHDELLTYSYPTEPLYVAYQDPASIAKAKQMIQEILNGD